MSRVPEEVLVFARPAAFGLIVGAVYWFVSYERAGTVLLLGFGTASGFASVMIWLRSRRARRSVRASGADVDRADWPFHEDTARVPAPGYAPFIVGLGAGVGALGLAFGPLLLLSGLIVLLIGARYWLEAAMRETDATAAQERPGGQRP
jgi:hypothetical protein